MIGAVENAIIARIQAAQDSGALGYRLVKVTTYAGDLAEGIKSVARALPAVWVVFSGATAQRVIARTRVEVSATYSVIVAANSLRNEREGRHGSGAAPGAYQIVEDIVALLGGRSLDIQALRPLQLVRIEALYNDRSEQTLAAIYGITFETGWQVDLGEDAGTLDDFRTFHANWDLPAHGEVGPALPDDTHAQATDHITLEGP